MKTLLSITLCLFITLTAKAQTLEAPSVTEMMKAIEESSFKYKERGMIFGFNSIQSCLYQSEDFAIFKNYCYPVKKYPARGYTIISKKFGMIDLYEEKLPGVLKRDITITQFPEILAPYLSTPIPQTSLNGLSEMIEKMYYRFNPGCWSTNYGWDSNVPEYNCSNGADVVNMEAWGDETQSIVIDEATWFALMDSIERKLK